MRGNLFVVSRLGQLRNAQSLIAHIGATDNHLAVLHTAANPTLTSAIAANVDDRLFSDVQFVQQPMRPVTQGPRKNRQIYRQLETLLTEKAGQGVERVVLCNVDTYYSLVPRVIARRGLKMDVVLLEEGLSTYAKGNPEYRIDSVAAWSDVRAAAKSLASSLLRAARRAVSLIETLVSWVFRADIVSTAKRVVAVLTIPPSLRYGTVERFDEAWVYFPEKLADRSDVSTVHLLPFAADSHKERVDLSEIEDGATVFVSQKYVEDDAYFSIVFDILSEMGVSAVYFKLHPRESLSAPLSPAWARAALRHPAITVHVPESIQTVPAETLMAAGKVGTLVGLTSTSLMYGRAFFPALRVVSVARRFRELAMSEEYAVSKRALAEFVRDYDVFADVSDVEQF
jgi:hypothetical protein